MDLISVIVPVFNAEKYLNSCIESILSQSYENLELLLINDGSTDNSLDICKRYNKIDNRIRVISKQNSGVSNTRNHGIEVSKGEYITFVDSDDMIKENMLKVLYERLLENKADLSTCNYEYDYSGHRIPKKKRMPSGYYKVSELKNVLIDDGTMSGILFGSVWNCLYKKRIITENNIRFATNVKHNEDGLFNLNYFKYCDSIYALNNEHLYIYRYNEVSASNSNYLNKDRFKVVDKEIIKLYSDEDINNQMCAREVSVGFWNILSVCKKNNPITITKKIKTIRDICYDSKIIEGLGHINTSKINKYKKTYYYLMKNKQVISIYLLTSYVYPILKRVIVR